MVEKLSKNEIKTINKNLKKVTFYDKEGMVVIKKYTISEDSFIASGGQACVYRLLYNKKKSPYVLKVYKSGYNGNSHVYQKYEEKDAEIRRLRNKNILSSENRYVFDDRYVVVEEYHKPLEEYRACSEHNRRRDDVEIAVIVADCLLKGFIDLSGESGKMKYAICHFDVKPENILMKGDTIDEGFVLTDFGVAAYEIARGGDTLLGIGIGGSYATMAPEVPRQDINNLKKSDMYSLGVTLYYYLEGCYPGGAGKGDMEIHLQRLGNKNFRIKRPAKGSERFKDLVMKAMAYDPKDRFASYTEMYEELKKCSEYSNYVEQRYGTDKTVFLGKKTSGDKIDLFEDKKVSADTDDLMEMLFELDFNGDRIPKLSLEEHAKNAAESRKKKVENFVLHIDDLEDDVEYSRSRLREDERKGKKDHSYDTNVNNEEPDLDDLFERLLSEASPKKSDQNAEKSRKGEAENKKPSRTFRLRKKESNGKNDRSDAEKGSSDDYNLFDIYL